MIVGFTTTYASSAYHHWSDFESESGLGVQHYVIKFVNWNIVESGAKHHQTKKQTLQWADGDVCFVLDQHA
jgi:hypothetical protein